MGYERKSKGKVAGIRTHTIVAIASALMMIVSKYGFNDLMYGEEFKLDPSRVASQIVSGVGFLGAGMIFMKKGMVQGLTTAAGVWATAGIGMAIGSGMYGIGISASIVIVIAQLVMHKKWGIFKIQSEEHFEFSLKNSDEAISALRNYLESNGVEILDMSLKKVSEDIISLSFSAYVAEDFDRAALMNLSSEYIYSIDV